MDSQRTNPSNHVYGSYLHSTTNLDELNSQPPPLPPPPPEHHHPHHKYLPEHHPHMTQLVKCDPGGGGMDESAGPIYPRPMYHYDPLTGVLPPGFSAINLSVKIGAAGPHHPALLAQHHHQQPHPSQQAPHPNSSKKGGRIGI